PQRGIHVSQADRRHPIQENVGDDWNNHEEIKRADVTPRRLEPEQPENANCQHNEENIDPPTLRNRIGGVDEIGEPIAHEGPAGPDSRRIPRARSSWSGSDTDW